MLAEICEGEEIKLNLGTPITPTSLLPAAVPYILEINDTLEYEINNDGTRTSNLQLISYEIENAGIYTYNITDFYDTNGCGVIDPVNYSASVIVNPRANVIVTSTADTGEICKGDLAFINFQFTSGTAPWEITLSKNGAPLIFPPYNNSTTIPQSLYEYETEYNIISLNDAKGCNIDPFITDIPFIIRLNPLPVAELYCDKRFICDDGSTTEMIFTINSGTALNNGPYDVKYSVDLDNESIKINSNSAFILNTDQIGNWEITEVIET